MFGIFNSLAKAAIGVVVAPVAVVADVVTLGGALNDKSQPYTLDAAENIVKNIGDSVDPSK